MPGPVNYVWGETWLERNVEAPVINSISTVANTPVAAVSLIAAGADWILNVLHAGATVSDLASGFNPMTAYEIQALKFGGLARSKVPCPGVAAKTPQQIWQDAMQQSRQILDSTYAEYGGPDAAYGQDFVDLTNAEGQGHILDRHGPGRGMPGKSEFPATWTDEGILHQISDIATDSTQSWTPPDARGYITTTKMIDGVDVRVVFDSVKGRIVTGYPINLPLNP
jgi:hypothetical protein